MDKGEEEAAGGWEGSHVWEPAGRQDSPALGLAALGHSNLDLKALSSLA